jgi:hypothetical protein
MITGAAAVPAIAGASSLGSRDAALKAARSSAVTGGLPSPVGYRAHLCQPTLVAPSSQVACAKRYDRKTPITVAALWTDRGVPFCDERGIPGCGS